MSWVGVLGVGATAVVSVRCSKKADAEDDPRKKALAYAPAVALGVMTSACILGVNHISDREIAALAAGCAYMAKHKGEAKQLPGVKSGDKAIVRREEDIAPWEGPSVEWTGNGTMLCLDAYSGRLFYSSRAAVEHAEEELSDRFEAGEELLYNEFYELLGMSETDFGRRFMWSIHDVRYDGTLVFVNRETLTERGEKMMIIDLLTMPFENLAFHMETQEKRRDLDR